VGEHDLRPFFDTDDYDKIDISDALPNPQLLPSLLPKSGGSTTTARKPRRREKRLGSKNEKKPTKPSFRVKHFEKLFMQTDSG
jgi:hypothetical protein